MRKVLRKTQRWIRVYTRAHLSFDHNSPSKWLIMNELYESQFWIW